MYENILVAIDGSSSAERALKHAWVLAGAFRSRLTLISIVPSVPAFAYRAGIDVALLESEAEAQTVAFLKDAAEGTPQDVTVTTLLKHGHPGPEIVKELGEGHYDLLILGSRGRGRLASTLLGSVGGTVHFHTPTPMLIVQDTDEAT